MDGLLRRRIMVPEDSGPQPIFYQLSESEFLRKKGNGQTAPNYYQTTNSRISYPFFDLRLDGGKKYLITATATSGYAPQMGVQFYNQTALDYVAAGQNIPNGNVYDPGWKSLTLTVTPPANQNSSPIRGVRLTFRQSTSNPTIADDFSILSVTIQEVT